MALYFQNLYDNFVSEKSLGKVGETEKHFFDRGDKPKQGNTIFVSGCKITEEFLRKSFSTFGLIVDVSMETGKELVAFSIIYF
jgi:negative elongation factor E